MTYAESELFLVRPGDSEEFVYSPVGVNATLHCVVNNTNLSWLVARLNFNVAQERGSLHSRWIFQTPSIRIEGITELTVTVFGDESNNNTEVCCRFFETSTAELNEACTTIVIYCKEN